MFLPALFFAFFLPAASVNGPADLDKTLQSLKDAQAKNDAAQVKALAQQTYAAAKDVVSSTAPAAAEDKQAWSDQVEYAKSAEVQTEYAVYATAVQLKPSEMVDMLAFLEQLNPSSRYLDEGYGAYFYALRETGAAAKIPAVAEKALAHFPNNDEILLVLADNAMTRKQNDHAIALGLRAANAVSKRPKPEGLSAADWERRRTTALGHGNWVAGVLQCEKGQYYQGNETLRAALPYIKGNDAMMGPALFYLGLANYQLARQTLNRGQLREAAKFSDQAAAIKGPYQQQAYHNSLVMSAEADRMH